MKVHWTENAAHNLEMIHAFISQDAPLEADRVVGELISAENQLEVFPRSGRSVPEYESPDIRELIKGSYRLIYRLGTNHLEIVAVLHSAKILPTEPPA